LSLQGWTLSLWEPFTSGSWRTCHCKSSYNKYLYIC
jgi:hypothetical protein